ncbi:hypothetical protein BS78_02G253200 [Paspalum vaginatum]|nr:hypothetical protein BS78_02G253200 [Paspalum vaginatum]
MLGCLLLAANPHLPSELAAVCLGLPRQEENQSIEWIFPFLCGMMKRLQCSKGKGRMLSCVPNAILAFLSSVIVSFGFPKHGLNGNRQLKESRP